MWWAFLIQFISALLVVGLRSFRGSKKIHAYDLFLTLGGSGVRNALWAGPSISLALTYIGYSLFWGGIHGVGG
jgi:hypothetical protein